MKNFEKKSIAYECKFVKEDENLYIEGYASIFGNVDSYNDIVVKGAFNPDKRVKLCYQHDFNQVIGKIQEIKEDDKGLWFRAKISNTTLGKDVAILIDDGAIDEISIGYRVLDWTEKAGIRILEKLYLFEISIVTRAANELATIQTTEKKEEQEEEDVSKLTDEQLIEKQQEINNEIIKRTFEKI